MQHDVEGGAAIGVHKALDGGAASGRGDVLDQGMGATDGADREEIDADDEGADRGMANGDLEPPTGGGAEVEDGASGGQEAVFRIELQQLEGRTGAITLLLRQVVELILPLLSLDLPHLPRPGEWRETRRRKGLPKTVYRSLKRRSNRRRGGKEEGKVCEGIGFTGILGFF